MRYERDLKVRLQEQYRRLFKTPFDTYTTQLGYFRDFIYSTPALRALVEHINAQSPDVSPEDWVAEFTYQTYSWPPTEAARAKVIWHLMNKWADGANMVNEVHTFTSEGDFNARSRELTEVVIEPFVEYLQALLGTTSDVLYLLDIYRRRLEWFDRAKLFKLYEADTARGEAIYDADLRRFLLEQGIDYPFSQPASASGKADVVSGVDGEDPLVCEIKLFGVASYGVSYLARGVQQAVQYARDYGKTVGHLVIINLGDEHLELPTEGSPDAWPPRISVAGVTVYLIAINAKPRESASKLGGVRAVAITKAQLVEYVEAGD